MAINTAQIKAELEPGLYKVDGKYDMIPKQWSKLFKTQRSKLDVDRMARMRYLGLPALKSEGAQTTFDNSPGHRFTFNARTFEVGLGFAITRRAMEYNQYASEFSQNSMGLVESFAQFKEIMAANILNNATTYDANIGGDGKALCATDHPYDSGTWANRPTTDANLNETSLLNHCLAIRQNFVDEAGLKIFARPKQLVIPTGLIPTAERLLKSELRPGTANNDVNAIRTMEGGVTEYVVFDFLTSQTAWFLTTNIEGLIMLEKVKYETSMWTDDSTDNLLVKGYEMYTPTYNDPRAVYGSFPTS